MIEQLKCRKKIYWVAVLLVAILNFGFTLTNHTVGVDDERLSFYSGSGLIVQGRWGIYLTTKIFNSFTFLPFWREFLALVLILLGATLFAGLLAHYAGDFFNELSLVVFSCTLITFPYIAYNFIFTMTTIAFGGVLCLTASASYFALKFVLEQRRWYWAVAAILLLTYALGFIETAILYFVFAVMFCLLLDCVKKEQASQYTLKRFLLASFILLAFCILALIGWKAIGSATLFFSGHQSSSYISNYASFASGLRPMLSFLLQLAKYYANNFTSDIAVFGIVSAAFIIIGFAVVHAVLRRSIVPLLFAFAGGLASIAMYFLTMQMIPYRVYIYFCFFVAFGNALAYSLLRKVKIKKISLAPIGLALALLLVLNQSKLSNTIFYVDYLVYQQDLALMENLMYDIQAVQPDGEEKPVLFVGSRDGGKLAAQIGDAVGDSIFGWTRSDPYRELASYRLPDFFGEHGYSIAIAQDIDMDELYAYLGNMPVYPKEGYIVDVGDYILIRLGEISSVY